MQCKETSYEKKEKENLPLFGIGPAYVVLIVAVTFAAFMCRKAPILAAGRFKTAGVLPGAAGGLLIALGVFMWIEAVLVSKIDKGIKENRLVTGGIYAWVRNPIYSAFMIICTGVLVIAANAFLLLLPFLYWQLMSLLMKHTEEKWLHKFYGAEYEEYCRRVNRCIPWFPEK